MVYRCEEKETQKAFALKVLKKTVCDVDLFSSCLLVLTLCYVVVSITHFIAVVTTETFESVDILSLWKHFSVFQIDKKIVRTEIGVLLRLSHPNIVSM